MRANQPTLTPIKAAVLEAMTLRGHSANFAKAVRLGGAVICHRAAHRRTAHEPSEGEQWVAYWNGAYQGVWYHHDMFEQFCRARGWEIPG